MLETVRKVKRRVGQVWERQRERRELAPLYAPDPTNHDIHRHLSEAIDWLRRAQDSGRDDGISYGVSLGGDFEVSYPETTGYICQTFVDQERATGESDLLDRAVAMGDWEAEIQLQNGAVMGGKFNNNPTPAVFNTGMVLLGWSALIHRTNEERFKLAARRASDWLLSVQEPDGNWISGNSGFAKADSTVYNVKAAWGLCEVGVALGEDAYIRAAVRNAEYCLSRQLPNGWFSDCCLSDPNKPLLHTLAYTMQGLIGVGKLANRPDFVAGARRLADAQLEIMGTDGFLPGRQTSNFAPAVNWCCLTGSAQTSSVWSELYLLTNEDRYREAACCVNRYLMSKHDIRNPDPRLRGGVPGSWPVWGGYGRLSVLNWAAKFLVDALSFELRIDK